MSQGKGHGSQWLTLCNPMDCSLPGPSVHGILQARILEWVAIPFPGYHPNPGIKSRSPALQADSLSSGEAGEVKWSEVAQSCPTLCDPMDCSLPGSIHEIFQARILEWVAISFSRGSSRSREWTWVSRISGRRFTVWATRDLKHA